MSRRVLLPGALAGVLALAAPASPSPRATTRIEDTAGVTLVSWWKEGDVVRVVNRDGRELGRITEGAPIRVSAPEGTPQFVVARAGDDFRVAWPDGQLIRIVRLGPRGVDLLRADGTREAHVEIVPSDGAVARFYDGAGHSTIELTRRAGSAVETLLGQPQQTVRPVRRLTAAAVLYLPPRPGGERRHLPRARRHVTAPLQKTQPRPASISE